MIGYTGPVGIRLTRILMTVKRIVAAIASARLNEARTFYGDLLGLDLLMDHGWIQARQIVVTQVDPWAPGMGSRLSVSFTG